MVYKKSDSTNFGRSVSNTLADLDLTQNDLSERLGKNPKYVNHTMTGYRKPSAEYVELVANALKLSEEQRIKLHRAAALDNGFKLDLMK